MSRLRIRPGRRRAFLSRSLILLAACLPGCRKEPAAPISQQKFVDAYVQLVQARIDAAGDSVAYAAKRDRVFLDTGVRPADLRAFVESGRRDPMPLRDAWQSIAARLDTIYGGVTSGPPAGLREALRTRGDTSSVSPRVVGPGTSTPGSRTVHPPERRPDSAAARRGAAAVSPRVTAPDSSRLARPNVGIEDERRLSPIQTDSLRRAGLQPADTIRPALPHPATDSVPTRPSAAAGDSG